jgi:hypothetical protein
VRFALLAESSYDDSATHRAVRQPCEGTVK